MDKDKIRIAELETELEIANKRVAAYKKALDEELARTKRIEVSPTYPWSWHWTYPHTPAYTYGPINASSTSSQGVEWRVNNKTVVVQG